VNELSVKPDEFDTLNVLYTTTTNVAVTPRQKGGREVDVVPVLSATWHGSMQRDYADAVSFVRSGPDHTVQLQTVDRDGQEICALSYHGHSDEITALAWSPDRSHVVSASKDRTVQIWDVYNGEAEWVYRGQEETVRVLSWSPNGRYLLLGSESNVLQIVSLAERCVIATYHGHLQTIYGVNAVTWSPDSKRIASASSDTTIQVWEAMSGEVVCVCGDAVDRWILNVAWSPDGRWIAGGGDDVHIWNADSGAYRRTLAQAIGGQHWVDGIAWSPDSQLIAVSRTDRLLSIWHVGSGQRQYTCSHAGKEMVCRGLMVNAVAWASIPGAIEEPGVVFSIRGEMQTPHGVVQDLPSTPGERVTGGVSDGGTQLVESRQIEQRAYYLAFVSYEDRVSIVRLAQKQKLHACLIDNAKMWDEFVARCEYGTITQSYAWGVLAQHAGSMPLHIGVVDEEGNLQAAMLVLISRLPTLHSTYFYVPRGPVLGDPETTTLTLLLDFVKREAKKRGAFMLKIEPCALDGDEKWIEALRREGFRVAEQATHVRNEWILDVRADEDELLARMKEKWRYNIRLAQRKGVNVRRGQGEEDLAIFYTLLQETSRRDHFFIHESEHYELFMRLYGKDEQAELLLAEYQGKVIAGIILLRYGRWCWYRYGASSVQARNVMPNHLLQWTGIQWAKAHGCWYYNFLGIPTVLEEPEGRKDTQWGVYCFKRGFGGHARLSMGGYDLPYNPIVYMLYRHLIDFKHRRQQRRSEKAFEMQMEKRGEATRV
jgi:peptidoglycan pentaglycine glycine transferase (the first glycine)